MQNFTYQKLLISSLIIAFLGFSPLFAQKKIEKQIAQKWQIDVPTMQKKMEESLEAELAKIEDEEEKEQQLKQMEMMMPMLIGMLKSMRMEFKRGGEMVMSLKNPMSGEFEKKGGKWYVKDGYLYTQQEKDAPEKASQESGENPKVTIEIEYKEEKKNKIIEVSKKRLVIENLEEKGDSPMKVMTLIPAED